MSSRADRSVTELKPRLPTHVVRGKVLVAGTNAPAIGIVAQLFRLNGDERQVSLGSVPVDDGGFEINWNGERAEVADDGARIKVVIVGRDGGESPPVLAESDSRDASALSHYFVIEVSSEVLANVGLVGALGVAARSPDPTVAAKALEADRQRVAARHAQMTEVRKRSVEELRRAERAREEKVSDIVIEQLTRVPKDSSAWRRLVKPGEDPRKVAKEYQQSALSTMNMQVLGARGARTYVALSDDERITLRAAPNDPDSVDTDGMERLLRRKRFGAELRRQDPFSAIDTTNLLDEPAAPSEPEAPPEGSSPQAMTPDEKVAELVNAIHAPETFGLGIPLDNKEIGDKVQGLTLAKGPADVPAHYEYSRLELAFDHVWEDARAEGYIERAKSLYRIAEDLGGDPASALASSPSPLRALKREAQFALAAAGLDASTGAIRRWIARDNGPKRPTGSSLDINDIKDPWIGPGDPPPPPDWPPQPPPHPPHTPPDGVGDLGEAHPADPSSEDAADYPFTVFAPDTVNFGIIVKYDQCFKPKNYQVGRLVGTRTLAPQESWSYTTKQVVKTSFNRKQIQSNQALRKDEAEDSYRDESEIVNRAQAKTNFAMNTSGSYDLGPLGEGSVTSSLGRDAETSSQETKRAQRSAIRKAAQEIRSEQRLEIETASSFEAETTETRKIENTSQENSWTAVFYQLHRCYEFSQQLSHVIPVALVAQRVPRPQEITEDWIIRHDWIIRRFLLDDSFQETLTYISTSAAGDRIVLADLQQHMLDLRAAVNELKLQITAARRLSEKQLEALQNFIKQRADLAQSEDSEGWLEGAWEAVAGSDDASKDSIRLLEDAARERYEKAVREEQDLRARLEREVTALQVATDGYVHALSDNTNHKIQIDRLIKHILTFILHYMQGIWSYEQREQQVLRQQALLCPRLRAPVKEYKLNKLGDWPIGLIPEVGKSPYDVTFTTKVNEDYDADDAMATLAELIDLDRPIGMYANLLIYPLKESNGLTDFMMTPYIDATLGLRDPDGAGNMTLEEFQVYVHKLRETLTTEQFEEIEADLEKQAKALLMRAERDGEDIVIPSNALYMQLLVDPGKVLEEFKAAHRAVDVVRAKAEATGIQLDNLRRAKLVLSNKLGDPNIETVKNVYYRSEIPPHDGDE